jgi:carbamate kinase
MIAAVSDKPIVVIAFGGNALIREGQRGTAGEQMENIELPMRKAVALASDYRVVISHGNGPQVGNILLQQEATDEVARMPVDVVGAMTQGQIGYFVEHALERELAEAGLDRNFLTVITWVEVDPDDPLFDNPTKPIGPVYSGQAAAKAHPAVRTDKGWRRVIASPKPIGIVQVEEIRKLVGMDWIVICAGGGGIPVVKDGRGHRGVEAVIDKDLASALLAREIGAYLFVIATDVYAAALDWGKPEQRLLVGEVPLGELRRYAEEGHFAPGSMGPKVAAMTSFAEATGKRAIVCHLDEIEAGVAGTAGTAVHA